MRIHQLAYRYADAVLDHPHFRDAKAEILNTFEKMQVPLLDPARTNVGGVKRRKRKATKTDPRDRYFFLPVDQRTLNKQLDATFGNLGWQRQPRIVEPGADGGPRTGLKGDYKKGRLQVEVQFGNMARWYTDVFKFQLQYSLNGIDVAALIVPMQRFANLIDENVAYFERVARELPHAKMSLTLPILVLGVEPDDYGPIRECYESAAATFLADKDGVAIPFDVRLAEEPVLEGEDGADDEDATSGEAVEPSG